MSQFFASGAQSVGASASASVLPSNEYSGLIFWFDLLAVRGTLRSLLQHHMMYMQSASCKMSGSMNHKLESRLPGKISITSDMQMIPLMVESKEETKQPLDEGERGE